MYGGLRECPCTAWVGIAQGGWVCWSDCTAVLMMLTGTTMESAGKQLNRQLGRSTREYWVWGECVKGSGSVWGECECGVWGRV